MANAGSGLAQSIRFEWISDTQDSDTNIALHMVEKTGTMTSEQSVFWGGKPQSDSTTFYLCTESGNAVIHIVDEYDKIKIENVRLLPGDAVIMLEPSVNLNDRQKLRIVQLLENNQATGTIISQDGITWTDSSAGWTTNQWVGYWLVFEDYRLKILSNTATALTVDPYSYVLNENANWEDIIQNWEDCEITYGESTAISKSYTLQSCVEWFPKSLNPDVADGLLVSYNDTMAYQTIVCSRIEQTGKRL